MSKNSNDNNQQPIEGEVIPANPTPRQIKLGTIEDCRREMGRVYRDARTGKIDPQTGTRLTYILISITNVIKDHELEKRIEKLEDSAK